MGDCWNTLGIAQYRARRLGGRSRGVAKQAMLLPNSGDGTDWFFLAMAHWQLDEKDKARTWYDKAVQWMDQNKPKDPEICRFRAEAAALLKVEDPQKQNPE